MAIKRDKILKTAEKLVQKGKLEQAIREYEKLLKASSDDTNTVNRLGDLYGRVGEIDKAVELYEQVAQQFSGQGFLPKAIAIYKKINRLAPQRLDIFERLGELYVEQGLAVEAKSQFQMLAEHYAKTDEMESAFRAHQRLAEIDPDDATSRLKFADLLLENGNSDEAMAAYGALGETLIKRGQIEEAERLFRRLLDYEIPDGEIMVPICDRLLDAGNVTSAQTLLTAGLKVSGESVSLRTLQVRASMALGETDSAVDLAQEILEVDPENPIVRGLVANVLMSDGDQDEATEMMIPAAEALLEKAEYSKAQKMLRDLVDISPDDERVLRLAIRAFRPSGDQKMLTRLTASLADVCYGAGQEDQAKRFYLELVASDPTNKLYRERLAVLDGAVVDAADGMDTTGFGDGPPSEISFPSVGADEGAQSSEPEPAGRGSLDYDPTEAINEAAVFAKYGLNDKAVSHLEALVRQLPNSDEARKALARTYQSVGESDRAAKAVQPVIDRLREAGDLEAVAELEGQFDLSSVVILEEDDDEVIIVEIDGDEVIDGDEIIGVDEVLAGDEILAGDEFIDGDEMSDADFAEVVLDATNFDDLSIEDMVAGAVGSNEAEAAGSRPGPSMPPVDTLLAGALGMRDDEVESSEDVIEPIELESEVVEEELVEISSGAQGPSFNELAQLDLFIEQELFEDAASILERLEEEFPDDPDLAERWRMLDDLGLSHDGTTPAFGADAASDDVISGGEPPVPTPTIPPRAPEVQPVSAPEDIFGDDDGGDFIDLAKELEEELAEEEAMVEEATGRGKGEALLDEVFKEFQKGVAEQLSDEDSDTHFNLGIAYKEMGLLEQGIGEFEVASHDPAFFVEACTMIGVCANELGRFDDAAEWYQKALVAPDLSDDARTALRYELATAFERTGEIDQAIDLFSEIHGNDPAYRDVSVKLAQLTLQRQVN